MATWRAWSSTASRSTSLRATLALCFAIEDNERVIIGGAVFEGGPGKTWTVQDFQTMLQTLRGIILSWPDDTACYPGHGPSFRLGDKRAAIVAFLAKDHGDFFGDATWEMGAQKVSEAV